MTASEGIGRRPRALAVAALLAVCAGLLALATGALSALEDDAVDARFSLRADAPPSELAVVAVDDVSFSVLREQWPLPRSIYAEALERLKAAGAAQVVFDVQFTEPTSDKEDFALYDAIGAFGGAVLATSESDERGRTNVLGGDEALAEIDSRAAAANLPDSRGGVVRRVAPRIGRLDSLAVAVAERAGRRVDRRAFEAGGAWIDFRGGPGTVPTVSLADLLDRRFDPSVLRNRIVVIGASAPTVGDVHATSTTGQGSPMAGPEVQANAIWTALHGLPLRSAPGWVDLLAVLALGLLAPLVAARFGVLAATGAALVLGAAFLAGAYAAFLAGWMLTVTPALLALLVSAVATVLASHLGESRERRRIAHLNALLDARVRERTQEITDTQLEIIGRLGRAVESRDGETGAHITRISRLCHDLALAAGLSAAEAEEIRHASVMHDIGKIAVPDRILYKPGRFDAHERALMQAHAAAGGDILAGSRIAVIRTAETIARTHHERWDGAGYPAGLAGEDIPLAGRICAVADVFDALTSERPYKHAWPVAEALAEIREQRGRQFDPRLVDLFLAMMPAPEAGAVPELTTAG